MGMISRRESEFGHNLDEMRIRLALSKVDLAQKCNLTYPYINKLIKGERRPSLDTLCKIAYGLSLPFVEVAVLAVNSEKWDEEKGEKRADAILPNNPRRKKDSAGTFLFISETFLREKYSDYSSDRFREFIKRYIGDYTYSGVYEEFVRIRGAETLVHEVADETITKNEDFREIVQMISTLTDKQLGYIRKQLQLFVEYREEEDDKT